MTKTVNIPALLHSAHPAVHLDGDNVVTSSIEVARVFEKRHDHVMRDIQNLLKALPDEHAPNFGEMSIEHARNFALMSIIVDTGNGARRESPVYHLTRDGFTLLAMGFTGKKALAFKLAYINAFNKMEAELRTAGRLPPPRAAGVPPPPPPPPEPAPAPTKTLIFTMPLGEFGQRWLLHTDRHGREHVTPLSPDTHISTPDDLIKTLVHSPADARLSLEQQLSIASAFLRNAHQAAAGYGKRLGLTPGSRP